VTPTKARDRMVAAIAACGAARDPAVLAALASVPREAFVPRFWTAPGPGPGARTFDATGDRPDPEAVRLVYDMDRALAIRWDPGQPGGTTSTASAPRLMATMLELLELRPGLRVLEIGTGSGYNLALLAELVGDASLVTSVDIDAGLVEDAVSRLAALGYGGARLLVGDGTAGVPDAGPFDRVVVTVGCVDLAPAWLSQLAPDGFDLLPLLHGAAHPLVRTRPNAAVPGEHDPPGMAGATGAIAEVVGRSGFVAIQGRQAGRSPWVARGPLPSRALGVALPRGVARALAGGEGRHRDGLGWWDLGYYLAIGDRRASLPAGLTDGAGSGASISPTAADVNWYGPQGSDLRDRLLALVVEWLDAGRPAADDFECRFAAPAGPGFVGRVGSDEWAVDRVDYRQSLRLRSISGSPR
jgi:protein-L-isoaspartate(D-aspartate) O-methyltransferase